MTAIFTFLLRLSTAHNANSSLPPYMPSYMTWYGCDPVSQKGMSNLCISKNSSLLVEARRTANMAGLADVIWCFFENAQPPRHGLQLQTNFPAGWRECLHGRRELDALHSNGTILGTLTLTVILTLTTTLTRTLTRNLTLTLTLTLNPKP